jgi:predicted peroxiredoxin
VLDKIDISKEERASLAAQLGFSPASAPSNHGEFIRLLRGKGVELYANEEMMRIYRIAKDKYDTSVIPVGLDRMMELLSEADAYLSY